MFLLASQLALISEKLKLYNKNSSMKQRLNYDWHTSVYKYDIYNYLKILEQEYSFRNNSTQLHYRCGIIRWLKLMYLKLDFCSITLHLAIFLLDYFMDNHVIKSEKLSVVALVCLLLAGKFEEQDSKIPKISEMNKYLKCTYRKKDILYLEITIMKFFNWKLTMPTTIHFAEYYLNYSVVPQDICENCSNYAFVFNIIRNTVNQYLDILLEDSYLISLLPSFVAASCILAVRKNFELQPFWPNELKNASHYCELELLDCSLHIAKFIHKYHKQLKRKLDQVSNHGCGTGKKKRIS